MPCTAATATPISPPFTARALARPAVYDVLGHFWTGDETSGHIVNTWHGYGGTLPDARGGLWERATLYIALDNASRALGDPGLAELMLNLALKRLMLFQ